MKGRRARKRHMEILLIAALINGALLGSSLTFADRACSCCEVAYSCQNGPLAFGARLCCLFYCSQSGEHAQSSGCQLSRLAVSTIHQQSERSFHLISDGDARRIERAIALNSRPQYILHLALLI
ncbi:hypothetical protein PYK22_00319 [Pyrinomonas methylaliphatogenes]|uniref:Uncharacterized protein n=1 Tax=Pyrinomonas methylaliphatogenes TaxID=454194 RepID=A0A0B6WTG5_9BACT|nr:hypothetical protein PYK22_00319 [Pyrinomonas methylaliphatogenes]